MGASEQEAEALTKNLRESFEFLFLQGFRITNTAESWLGPPMPRVNGVLTDLGEFMMLVIGLTQ